MACRTEVLAADEPPLLDRWVLGQRLIPCLFGATLPAIPSYLAKKQR